MAGEFFRLEHQDADSNARAGRIFTDHGEVQTPIFMPVGTQGTVKTLPPRDLREIGTQILLGNTYHLYLRPGDQLIRRAGGLHRFMAWDRPILTDSGGYQVFSLAELRKLSGEGVRFQSHIDGSYHLFTPEKVIAIERNIGADIIMVLDECAPYPATYAYARQSLDLTLQWAKKCKTAFENSEPAFSHRQFLFGIAQGSTFPDLRRKSVEELAALGFHGYAIGGLAVGEPKTELYRMTALCTELLPADAPRYLMGVGKPEDIVEAVGLGVDMFDCVIPTRNGRNGTVFTWNGRLVIKNAAFKEDFSPIDEGCTCYACRNFSRAYIRHLFQSDEILGLYLASLHNLHFYLELLQKAREAILQDRYGAWKKDFYSRYHPEDL